jgi:hypothetical protein
MAAMPMTAGELIDVLTMAVVHHDVPLLAMSKADLNHPATLRRLAEAVAGIRGQIPAGMDSAGDSVAVPTILVVANGLVTGLLGEGHDTGRPRRLGWLARRRLAARLSRRVAPVGAATPLPALPPDRAARVLADVRAIAVNARLTERETDDLCACLQATLDKVAGR